MPIPVGPRHTVLLFAGCFLLSAVGCGNDSEKKPPDDAGAAGGGSGNAGKGGKGGKGGVSGTSGDGGASGAADTSGKGGKSGAGGTTGGAMTGDAGMSGDGTATGGATTGDGGMGGDSTSTSACPAPTGDEILHDQETITKDTTWSGVHRIGLNFSVHALLTIEPCTLIKFTPGHEFRISNEGAVHAVGKPGKPITFTSDRRTPAAGDWSSIVVWNDASNDTTFEHVIVEYATTGLYIDDGATAALSDVVVRDTTAAAIVVGEAAVLPRFEQVSAENSGSCLTIGGNEVRQLDSFSCTGALDPTIGISAQESVTQAATWKNFGVPYKILGVNVGIYGAIVELDPGVEIQLNPGLDLNVTSGGALRALGTKEQPVIFQSSKPGPAPGDWGSLQFDGSGSANSLLRWTEIRHAEAAVYLWGMGQVAVENVDFSESACGVSDTHVQGGTLTEVAGSKNDLGAVCD